MPGAAQTGRQVEVRRARAKPESRGGGRGMRNYSRFILSVLRSMEFTRCGGGVLGPAGNEMLQLQINPAVEIQIRTQLDPHRHVPMFTADAHVSKQVLIQTIHGQFPKIVFSSLYVRHAKRVWVHLDKTVGMAVKLPPPHLSNQSCAINTPGITR